MRNSRAEVVAAVDVPGAMGAGERRNERQGHANQR